MFKRQPTFGPPIQTLYFETKRTISENLGGGGHGAQTLKYHFICTYYCYDLFQITELRTKRIATHSLV